MPILKTSKQFGSIQIEPKRKWNSPLDFWEFLKKKITEEVGRKYPILYTDPPLFDLSGNQALPIIELEDILFGKGKFPGFLKLKGVKNSNIVIQKDFCDGDEVWTEIDKLLYAYGRII